VIIIGNMKGETTVGQSLFSYVNRVYRASARLQYTMLHNPNIDYGSYPRKSEELESRLDEAAGFLDDAIDILKEIEAHGN